MSTDRQRRDKKIKTGALQEAIFNSEYFSSIATDERGVIQIFNVGAERMLGYSADDVVNKITPADISDPKELVIRASELSAELQEVITPGFEALVFKASRGIEDMYELTYIRKDGSRFPAIVSVTALRDADDGIIGYLLIGTDNTARKRIEAGQALLDQRLREQQFYTRSLIESNIDALMMTDPLGTISDVNQQMVTLTGRTREELIGSPSRNFFTDPASADAAIDRVLSEKRVSNYELTVRAKNGAETVVSYSAATFYDADDKLQGVFAAARDATERKRFEHALQEKNIELEHASRMKSEFLATMSHELRTPLNAIIGFSDALKDGLMGPLSAMHLEYIGDIFTSGQHLLSLINDILDLSKVEAGMMDLEFEPADLHGLLQNTLSIVRDKAAAQRIQVDLEVDSELRAAALDTRKTKQIVYNLLSNAVKFGGVGGRVVVRARRVVRSEVGMLAGAWPSHCFPLADNEFEDFVEICVTDGGLGITSTDMAKLFQPFSQIDSSLARKFECTGLCFAMVKQLAELHGGSVGVSSAAGAGSRFAVWLPLREATSAIPVTATITPASAAPPRPQGLFALIIEDDDRAADLVRLLLEAEGFTAIRAPSAEEGLLLAMQQDLSLITLDVSLPGMDGWEFLGRIRENAKLAHVPVVVISGGVGTNMALFGGAAAVLQKPISRAQLKTSLANLGLQAVRARALNILVVDDDRKAVELIAAYLPTPDYKVVPAYGGRDAIALAQRLLPDLIILDLMMPDVNGFDVVETLQRQEATACIPILAVTAKQITAHDRAALNTRDDRLIEIVDKAGFNREAFVSEVRRALVRK